MDVNGVINIYKEKGFTSSDVVAIVKRELKCNKVGHTGTLDPNAQGVLPICIGKATKISQFIMESTKVYKAEVILGVTTDTEDITGTVINECNVNFSKDEVAKVVASFKGDYDQIPPMYSAIKINGRRLYKLARKGEVIERPSRVVSIFDITIDKFSSYSRFFITVRCSKGTYIRTLCSDIGKKLGCGAVMGDLIRTESGGLNINTSITIENLKTAYNKNEILNYVIPIDSILSNYKKVKVSIDATKFLYNGNKISLNYVVNDFLVNTNDMVLVYDYSDKLISISKVIEGENKVKFIRPISMVNK